MRNNDNEEKIMDAALKVVSQNTISGTRTAMIAEEAGMTPSNLHYYYKSKDEILNDLRTKVFTETFRDPMAGDIPEPQNISEALDYFFLDKIDYILRRKEYDYVQMDFWVQAHVDKETGRLMTEGYEAWLTEIRERVIEPFAGDQIPDFDKDLMAHLIISMMQGASIQYHLKSFNLMGYFSYCKYTIRGLLKIFELV